MKERPRSSSNTPEQAPQEPGQPLTWFAKFTGSVALYRQTAREVTANGGIMPIEPPLSPQEIERAYNRGYYSATSRLLGEIAAQNLVPAEQAVPAILEPNSGDNYPIAC